MSSLSGLFNGTTGLKLVQVCSKHVNKKADLMEKEYRTLVARKNKADMRCNLIELANFSVLFTAIFPFSVLGAFTLTYPLLPAERVLKHFKNKAVAYTSASVTYVSVAILMVSSLFIIGTPVCMLYYNTVEKLKKLYGTIPAKDEPRWEQEKAIIVEKRRAASVGRNEYLPCIKKIMMLFASESPLMNLPNELQYKILELGMPRALEILELVAKENNKANSPQAMT